MRLEGIHLSGDCMKICLEDSPCSPPYHTASQFIPALKTADLVSIVAQGDTSLWCVPIDHYTPSYVLMSVHLRFPLTTINTLTAFDILILSPPRLWVSQQLHFRGTLPPSQSQKEAHWNLQQGSIQNWKIIVRGTASYCVGPIQMQVDCLHMENIILLVLKKSVSMPMLNIQFPCKNSWLSPLTPSPLNSIDYRSHNLPKAELPKLMQPHWDMQYWGVTSYM